jgi:Fic family protein
MAGVIETSSLEITPAILSLIAAIDEFKGAWRAIGRIAPERLSALRRVATIESIGSSTRIEGAALSDREVERLLANLDVQTSTSRDEQEVAGYAAVMETVFESADAIDLTENHILQLHRDLLQFSEKDERHRGAYKTLPNHVEAIGPDGESLGIVFETATPFDTPRLMHELVEWTRVELARETLHPLIVIAIFVVVFLEIHPFQDGNGRLSRILTTLLLLRAGYTYVPYGSLESVIEGSKEPYYLALRQTQVTIRTSEPKWQAGSPEWEARTGAHSARAPTGALRATPRSVSRTRQAHRCDRCGAHGREPQHGQGSFESTEQGRPHHPPRRRSRDLVRAGLIG